MDPPSDEPNPGPSNSRFLTTVEGRPSVEARSPQTPPRLQKKRSNAGVDRAVSQSQTVRSAPVNNVQRGSTGTRDGQKARKGSLRNAVRRLFGRRSRETEPQATQSTPPRHGYHRSEPYTVLATPQPAIAEDTTQESEFAHRTFSAPIGVFPSPALRTRSPYAVEFPHSARLKPLNLGDPYTAPGSRLRRRKTLPSVLIAGPEAAVVAAAVGTAEAPPEPSQDESEIGRALSTNEGDKRRSRSAGDLKIAAQIEAAPPRKRSDEIRYWRESFQASVLRASGFTVPVHDDDEVDNQAEHQDDEITPMPRGEDPFNDSRQQAQRSPPRRGLEVVGSDFASPSALGSQMSQDLEDRVARLEAGLQSFRGELQQMALDRNRRTVLIGGVPSPPIRRRGSSGGRTASMLAETLQTDLGPSGYQYDYRDTLRPSTSPQPPRTPPERRAAPAPSSGQRRPPAEDDPFTTTPSPPRAVPEVTAVGGNNGNGRNGSSQAQQPPQYTFRSLYEMLADERSARRRLELQLRNLRDEIARLDYQVSTVSNVQSQRSSYYAGGYGAMDPTVGATSSRLHALLRETEHGDNTASGAGAGPGVGAGTTGYSGRLRDSSGITIDPRVISRFSGSESEAGGMAESTELETPYEAYQTPIEPGDDFPFDNSRNNNNNNNNGGGPVRGGAGRGAGEGGMF